MSLNFTNTKCPDCGKTHASTLPRCPHCCPHDNPEFDEQWCGCWVISVTCADCYNDWDFDADRLNREYKIVKKTEEEING